MEWTYEQARWATLADDLPSLALYEIMLEKFKEVHYMIYAGIAITVIIGVIILLNQRKIRKELRQLREMMENQDKPNGEI